MGRRITLAGAMLSAALVIAVAAVPVSARVPGGEGLVSFGPQTCEGIGEIELFGPRAPQATSGYLMSRRTPAGTSSRRDSS